MINQTLAYAFKTNRFKELALHCKESHPDIFFSPPGLFFFFFNFLLVLKGRMAHQCAAAHQTLRHPQVQVWFFIPIWQLTASGGSPSCTALTATMSYHQNPYPEILPSLENCEWF